MASPEFRCEVRVQYLPDRSTPPDGPWAFAYTVTIRNTGDATAQLIGRHWVITDSAGHREEVRGLAVVGHQPLLAPGEQFEYTSWTRIATPQGRMKGSLHCITEDLQTFEVAVPPFDLVSPGSLH